MVRSVVGGEGAGWRVKPGMTENVADGGQKGTL